MSGRIRTIKPELLEDAVTAGLSHIAFRLFIGCILLADDYGNLRFELPWLRGQVFWAREVTLEEFASAIEELTVPREGATEPLVGTYIVKGQRYAAIRGWAKHQRVQKPGKPRVPGPEMVSPESGPTLSGESPETLRPDLRSPIVEDDPERGTSARAPARESTHEGVASLEVETPAVGELEASLDTPIPNTWRARGEAIIARVNIDFDLPATWAKYRASCLSARDRNGKPCPRMLTEPGWITWAENEARFAAERLARREDTAWGKLREAQPEPNGAPYHGGSDDVYRQRTREEAIAKRPENRTLALEACAALAAGNFGPAAVRKAGGT